MTNCTDIIDTDTDLELVSDAELISRMQAAKVAELAALRAEHEATMAELDRRFWAANARIARYATVIPAVLGALNVAGLI